MAQTQKSRDEEARRTAEALRLVNAFSTLDNPSIREALILLAEQLVARQGRQH